jgi:hypothetical protein
MRLWVHSTWKQTCKRCSVAENFEEDQFNSKEDQKMNSVEKLIRGQGIPLSKIYDFRKKIGIMRNGLSAYQFLCDYAIDLCEKEEEEVEDSVVYVKTYVERLCSHFRDVSAWINSWPLICRGEEEEEEMAQKREPREKTERGRKKKNQ